MAKKLLKNIKDQISTNLILSTGASAVTSVGGNAKSLSTFARYQTPLASIQGGGAVIRAVKNIMPKQKKKKQR